MRGDGKSHLSYGELAGLARAVVVPEFNRLCRLQRLIAGAPDIKVLVSPGRGIGVRVCVDSVSIRIHGGVERKLSPPAGEHQVGGNRGPGLAGGYAINNKRPDKTVRGGVSGPRGPRGLRDVDVLRGASVDKEAEGEKGEPALA